MGFTIKTDSLNIVWHVAEVAGRLLGVARSPTLVPAPEKKSALEAVAERLIGTARNLFEVTIAGKRFEYIEQRLRVGEGRGLDRGWDATVSTVADKGRVSLPDRSTNNPDYREVFTDGTIAPYTKPTIKQDPEIGSDLRKRISTSRLPNRDELVADLDKMLPLLEPAAKAVIDGEKQVNDQFLDEVNARKLVIDTLWEERRTVEKLLGRAGRNTARFIFFDDDSRSPAAAEEPPAEEPPAEEPPNPTEDDDKPK